MTTKTVKPRVSTKDELKRLAEENEALKAMLANSSESFQEVTKIPLDDLIPVMSLLPYTLNLSTLGNGKGKEIKFTQYGQVKQVLYQDVLGILEYHYSFAEYGYFIILDQRVIKRHGLQETYGKILTKEKIDQILSGSKPAYDLYSGCNAEQQRIIVGMLIEKLVDNPDSVDLNLVDKISRASGVNIKQKADESREVAKIEKDEE